MIDILGFVMNEMILWWVMFWVINV